MEISKIPHDLKSLDKAWEQAVQKVSNCPSFPKTPRTETKRSLELYGKLVAEASDALDDQAEIARAYVRRDYVSNIISKAQKLPKKDEERILFVIVEEMIKQNHEKTKDIILGNEFLSRVGSADSAILWSLLYVSTKKDEYLQKALACGTKCIEEDGYYTNVYPFLKIWEITGSSKALNAAHAIATHHQMPAVQVRAHNLIGRHTGETSNFISAFNKCTEVVNRHLRVDLIKSLMTSITLMSLHLASGSTVSTGVVKTALLTREQLEQLLADIPNLDLAYTLKTKLNIVGIKV